MDMFIAPLLIVFITLQFLPTDTYVFKVYNKNTRTMCETYSNITIKTRRWRRSGVFIVNSEQISHIFLALLLLTLNK